jgi:hypothetical protein
VRFAAVERGVHIPRVGPIQGLEEVRKPPLAELLLDKEDGESSTLVEARPHTTKGPIGGMRGSPTPVGFSIERSHRDLDFGHFVDAQRAPAGAPIAIAKK